MMKGMPKPEEIKENIEELIKKEKNVKRFQKLQMLYLIKTNQVKTRIDIGNILGYNRETIGDWLTKYIEGGIEYLLEEKEIGGSQSSLSEEIIEGLRQKLEEPESEFMTYEQIQKWVEEKYSIKTTYWVIYYTAREKLSARLAVGRKSHEKKRRFGRNLQNHF